MKAIEAKNASDAVRNARLNVVKKWIESEHSKSVVPKINEATKNALYLIRYYWEDSAWKNWFSSNIKEEEEKNIVSSLTVTDVQKEMYNYYTELGYTVTIQITIATGENVQYKINLELNWENAKEEEDNE